MIYFFQGFFWGIAYVAPIGMQNLFVINSALQGNKIRTFITALAVIFFDIMLALVCFNGFGSLLEKYKLLQLAVLFSGCILIAVTSFSLWRTKVEFSQMAVNKSWFQIVLTAGAVTWLNPQALIDGTVLLSAFKAVLPSWGLAYFISGVCSASVFWFSALAFFTYLTKQYFSAQALNLVNKVCGLLLLFYAFQLGIKFLGAL